MISELFFHNVRKDILWHLQDVSRMEKGVKRAHHRHAPCASHLRSKRCAKLKGSCSSEDLGTPRLRLAFSRGGVVSDVGLIRHVAREDVRTTAVYGTTRPDTSASHLWSAELRYCFSRRSRIRSTNPANMRLQIAVQHVRLDRKVRQFTITTKTFRWEHLPIGNPLSRL